MDKKKLAQSAMTGDDTAFLQLMHLYKIVLYKTALSYLKNEEEALEAIQEVTYRAYKHIHKLRQPAYVKTWFIRIMINYCNDQLRRKKRVVVDHEVGDTHGVSEDHSGLELNDAMQQLDERSREVLMLKYFHDLKIKEIASMMQRPEGTVKTWIHKALKHLRNMLEEGGDFYE